MSTQRNGIFQLSNGNWAYRFTKTTNGKRHNIKKTKDANGEPLKSQRAAIHAREIAILHWEAAQCEKPKRHITVEEIYKEYCDSGRSGKAYSTIRKQDSLWDNHICEKFGHRFVDGISVAEINDYLAYLYYVEGRAYKYVESFLKMFYLIFGQAYSRNHIDVDTYNKLCINKDVRISMPKMKVDEDTDIVIFNQDELNILDNYFHESNAETAYLLGRYCGLRINECYGITWSNIDIENSSITIEKQMQYQDGLIKLVSLKTRNAHRTVYMCQKLKEYFTTLLQQRNEHAKTLAAQRAQNQTVITDLSGKQISSLELVNSLPNGKIQTLNSMKYHSRTIKNDLNIDFKFHYLRHTYGTRLAEMNTPTHILCNQMGHASGKITERYYLTVSKKGIAILNENLNNL